MSSQALQLLNEFFSAVGTVFLIYNDENTILKLFRTDVCDFWDSLITSHLCYRFFIDNYLFKASTLNNFWEKQVLAITIGNSEPIGRPNYLNTILCQQPTHSTFWEINVNGKNTSDFHRLYTVRHTYPEYYYSCLIGHTFNISNVNIKGDIRHTYIPSSQKENGKNNEKWKDSRCDVLFQQWNQSSVYSNADDFIFKYECDAKFIDTTRESAKDSDDKVNNTSNNVNISIDSNNSKENGGKVERKTDTDTNTNTNVMSENYDSFVIDEKKLNEFIQILNQEDKAQEMEQLNKESKQDEKKNNQGDDNNTSESNMTRKTCYFPHVLHLNSNYHKGKNPQAKMFELLNCKEKGNLHTTGSLVKIDFNGNIRHCGGCHVLENKAIFEEKKVADDKSNNKQLWEKENNNFKYQFRETVKETLNMDGSESYSQNSKKIDFDTNYINLDGNSKVNKNKTSISSSKDNLDIDLMIDEIWNRLSKFYLIPKYGMKLASKKFRLRPKHWFILNGQYQVIFGYTTRRMNIIMNRLMADNIGIIYIIGIMTDYYNYNYHVKGNGNVNNNESDVNLVLKENLIVLKCVLFGHSYHLTSPSLHVESGYKFWKQQCTTLRDDTKLAFYH